MEKRVASEFGFGGSVMSRKRKRISASNRDSSADVSPGKPGTATVSKDKNRTGRHAFILLLLFGCGVALVLYRSSPRSLPPGYPDPPDLTQVNAVLREFLQHSDAEARRHHDSGEKMGALAMAYHANQFFESARMAYRLAVRLAPNDYRWFYCQALLDEDSAESDRSADMLERAIELQNYLPAYQRLAEFFFKRDELQKSAHWYARTLQLDPTLLWAVVGQARISARQGNWSSVIEKLQPAARQYPRIRAVHQLLADAYQAAGHSNRALECRKVLLRSDLLPIPRARDPRRDAVDDLCYLSTPLLKLAYAAEAAEDYEKMLQFCRRAVEVDPGDADARHFVARAIILARGAGSDAIAETMTHRDEGLRLRSDYPDPLMRLGQALMDRRHFKLAILQFETLLARRPEHAEAHNALGLALTGDGRMAEAVAHFREAVRLRPDYAEAHNSLGNVFFQQQNWKEAQSHYLHSLELMPGYAEASYNLANALVQEGKLDRAIAHFMATLRMKPDHAQAHNGLGVALLQQGKAQGAIAHFVDATKFAPDFAQAQYNWGLALARTGRLDEACLHLSEALRIKPGYLQAEESLRLVMAEQSRGPAGTKRERVP